MPNVLFISPGYPAEMALFTRGLATVGATVIGIGDQQPQDLPQAARDGLTEYVHLGSLAEEHAVIDRVRQIAGQIPIHRVECLWEPYMILAGRLREVLGLPGLTAEQTVPFRDKERMKQVLDAAGIRTPRHEAHATAAGVREAAERIGLPVIVKPIAGAGSADTHRIDSFEQLEAVLPRMWHVPMVSVEEFIDAEEFTFDTICANGEILFDNICWYRPRPLQTQQHEWVSPITVSLRDHTPAELRGGIEMGAAVLQALGFRDGFTHMEWYRKADGEVVFGEIGARPPGGRTVDVMNYATDGDLFVGWASAVVHGRLHHPLERRYNAASIFKRARGTGRIAGIDGLSRLMSEYGEWVAAVDLLPLGAPRRDWRQTLISDGMVVVRHPDLATTIEMADRFASELTLTAG